MNVLDGFFSCNQFLYRNVSMTDVLQLLHSVHFRALRADRTLLSQSVRQTEESKCLPRLSHPDTKIERSIVDIRQGVLLSTGGEDLLWVHILATNCDTTYIFYLLDRTGYITI